MPELGSSRHFLVPNGIVLIATLACTSLASAPAYSASHEQIVEMCRQSLHPQIMACAQAKGLRGNPEAVREQCGAPLVRPCVMRAEQKQAAGTPAPAAPKPETAQGTSAQVPTVFVAPPRTITDITSVLDREKPDPEKIEKRKAAAEAVAPTNVSGTELAQFYYDRGNARALLSRNTEALADGLKALEVAQGRSQLRQLTRIRQFIGLQYRALGDTKNALAAFDSIVRTADQPGNRGALINAMANMVRTLVTTGDLNQASAYGARIQQRVEEARGSPNPNWRSAYAIYGHSWESDTDSIRGVLFEARGQYREAEAAFRRAEAFRRASLKDLPKFAFPPPPEQIIQSADAMLLSVARNESRQGRQSEAEADARRALLGILKAQGKYAPATPGFIIGLAGILVEQGRYRDAEKLGRSALEVQRTLGIADESPQSVMILSGLGNILVAQGRMKEATAVYDQLDRAVANWPAGRREALALNSSRIAALYAAGQIDAGIAAAEALVKRQAARTGPDSVDAAAAHGTLALGYAKAKRDADAAREFRIAIPVLLASSSDSDDDDPSLVAARRQRVAQMVESFIGVLARSPDQSSDVAAESFGLADAVRSHSVEQALAASSARVVAHDPALAELVRNEQDAAKQIAAQLGALNNLLALPSDQRDEQTVRGTMATIDQLRAARKAAQQEFKKRFPAYADLIDPKPPTLDDMSTALRPNEALLSFYFGEEQSFVWAVRADGGASFAAIPTTAIALEAKVQKLRAAVEPQVAVVDEIPPFDLDLAYELYTTLLKPVEAGWQPAKNLIVVTNGALGELPLSLLPTAPAKVDAGAQPLFSGYRNVAWLARSHAVTILPSASALITLRHLPPGAANRDRLIGFGDPYFNAQQAEEAEAEQAKGEVMTVAAAGDAVTTRGRPLKLRASPHTEDVDVAELSMLPRLPDTRAELTAIAQALDVAPSTALHLGKDANEQAVETTDLSHYQIVAFATHGLVPGDIDGLTQPALALTAPEVAGTKDDGLLTMAEILALRLDADWVVLSACNTAAGAGAGAEAASGLGRAFFYAGTRALLVTNWSVHSASARELMTDLFRRQSADASLSRGEALRQAMIAMIDSGQSVDGSGQTEFTYAHPLFWAPYSIIGDSGGTRH
jgi:CHAT domain-containing protein